MYSADKEEKEYSRPGEQNVQEHGGVNAHDLSRGGWKVDSGKSEVYVRKNGCNKSHGGKGKNQKRLKHE